MGNETVFFKKMAFSFPTKFFTMGAVVNVLQAGTEKTFEIDIHDLLKTLWIFCSDIFYIFLNVKKKELVGYILL